MSPYIEQCYRPELDEHIDPLIEKLKWMDESIKTPRATYIVYKLLKGIFARETSRWFEKAQVYTVLDSVKEEYNENVIRIHERNAKERNGDI